MKAFRTALASRWELEEEESSSAHGQHDRHLDTKLRYRLEGCVPSDKSHWQGSTSLQLAGRRTYRWVCGMREHYVEIFLTPVAITQLSLDVLYGSFLSSWHLILISPPGIREMKFLFDTCESDVDL